ncbi:M15 family metallopeptidase [Pseudalkalibacillus berkeleyi]|uniref:M15 family metallopeptidase n=1 Tax=Pseudalkalibacillus berkeleyi TaxID=1069813 RepID=A0ABS9GWQ1_9BACL|nr:M15 family metallopeptidase [Pseudalkalibacillus berkeleyi]MCF6137217.1 M15 family metallopeptidase [Pseudalkalibacillus berkeleyi]
MKLHMALVGLTSLTLILGGCSSIPNPFEKEDQQNTDDQSHEDSQNQKDNQQQDTEQTDSPEEPKEPTNEEADLPSLEETVTVMGDGTKVVTNMNDTLVLVNKERNLPSDYIPEDLVIPNVPFPFEEDSPKKKMRKIAASPLEEMFAQAERDGIPLFAQSGYRSYDRQAAIFASNVQEDGEEEANKYSARPGQSEHQSGLTMDVTSPEVNFDLTQALGDTKTGIWLEENAHQFGFIIRYPEGKEEITGYQYEPWHLRYVGKKHAERIHEQNMTLEEYLGVPVEPVNTKK